MSNRDIVIRLKALLREKGKNTLVLNYLNVDSELGLLAGTTRTHIKEAAEASGYRITEEGETMIELRRSPNTSIRLQRG